jgi:hypothetical protein
MTNDLENTSDAPAANLSTPETKRPVSEARRRANRANAKKSTGPKLPKAKRSHA